MNRLFWVLLLSFGLSSSVVAEHQNIEWELRNSSSLIERAAAYQKQAGEQSEANQVLLSIGVEINAREIRTHYKIIWHFPTKKSVQKYGTETTYFNELNERLIFYTALTIDSKGKKHPFKPSSAQIIDSDSYTTFSDQKELVMAMPGLDSGSMIVLEFESRVAREKLEVDWSDIIYVNNLFRRDNLEISYRWPKSESFFWSNSSEQLSCQELASTLNCSAKSLKKYKSDYAVSWRDVLPQLIVGEMEDWAAVNRRASEAFNLAMSDVTGVKQLVAEIEQKNKNLEDKITAVHRFAARDIRYVSMSEYGNTVTPHKVASVLEARYGDCKDKSALLVAMLRELDLSAYPVLIATNRSEVNNLLIPSMTYFNHMIVCFPLDGQTYCVDATDQNTGWNYVSSWIQGKVQLPLLGAAIPSNLSSNQFRWELAVDTELHFDQLGGVEESLKRRFSGVYAAYMRNQMQPKGEEEASKWLKKTYRDLVSSRAEPKFEVESVDEMDVDLKIKSVTKYPPFVDVADKLSYTEYDNWLKDELDSLFLRNEYYPQLNQGFRYKAKMSIHLGSLWRGSRETAEINLVHRFGSMKRNVTSMTLEKMEVETEVLIPRQLISITDIPKFNKFLSLINNHAPISVGGLIQ